MLCSVTFAFEQRDGFIKRITEDNISLTQNEMAYKGDLLVKETTAQLYLTNIAGKTVFEKNIALYPTNNFYDIQLPPLPTGIYLVALQTKQSYQTTKIIIK